MRQAQTDIEKSISESVHQQRVIQWLEYHNLDYFAVPNGYYTTWSQAKKAKKEGMRSGVPDIIIITKTPAGQCVALEMKKYKGNKHVKCSCLSDEQKEWQRRFSTHGWAYVLAHGYEEAVKDLASLYLDNNN